MVSLAFGVYGELVEAQGCGGNACGSDLLAIVGELVVLGFVAGKGIGRKLYFYVCPNICIGECPFAASHSKRVAVANPIDGCRTVINFRIDCLVKRLVLCGNACDFYGLLPDREALRELRRCVELVVGVVDARGLGGVAAGVLALCAALGGDDDVHGIARHNAGRGCRRHLDPPVVGVAVADGPFDADLLFIDIEGKRLLASEIADAGDGDCSRTFPGVYVLAVGNGVVNALGVAICCNSGLDLRRLVSLAFGVYGELAEVEAMDRTVFVLQANAVRQLHFTVVGLQLFKHAVRNPCAVPSTFCATCRLYRLARNRSGPALQLCRRHDIGNRYQAFAGVVDSYRAFQHFAFRINENGRIRLRFDLCRNRHLLLGEHAETAACDYCGSDHYDDRLPADCRCPVRWARRMHSSLGACTILCELTGRVNEAQGSQHQGHDSRNQEGKGIARGGHRRCRGCRRFFLQLDHHRASNGGGGLVRKRNARHQKLQDGTHQRNHRSRKTRSSCENVPVTCELFLIHSIHGKHARSLKSLCA